MGSFTQAMADSTDANVTTVNNIANGYVTSATNHTIEIESNFAIVYFQVIVPLLFCTVTVVGVAGNTLVIYVIMFKHVARTVTNLLLLNLAIADLSFVIICPPFTAYT